MFTKKFVNIFKLTTKYTPVRPYLKGLELQKFIVSATVIYTYTYVCVWYICSIHVQLYRLYKCVALPN